MPEAIVCVVQSGTHFLSVKRLQSEVTPEFGAPNTTSVMGACTGSAPATEDHTASAGTPNVLCERQQRTLNGCTFARCATHDNAACSEKGLNARVRSLTHTAGHCAEPQPSMVVSLALKQIVTFDVVTSISAEPAPCPGTPRKDDGRG